MFSWTILRPEKGCVYGFYFQQSFRFSARHLINVAPVIQNISKNILTCQQILIIQNKCHKRK